VLTRRGAKIKTRDELDSYKKGQTLPQDLLQSILNEKVRPLFLRGD
jgi:hypothetical protein